MALLSAPAPALWVHLALAHARVLALTTDILGATQGQRHHKPHVVSGIEWINVTARQLSVLQVFHRDKGEGLSPPESGHAVCLSFTRSFFEASLKAEAPEFGAPEVLEVWRVQLLEAENVRIPPLDLCEKATAAIAPRQVSTAALSVA